MASKSRYQKDMASARRIQDDYALAERRYERSKARGKRPRTSRGSVTTSNVKNEGRVEGFLAGACATALAWLYATRKSWMGA